MESFRAIDSLPEGDPVRGAADAPLKSFLISDRALESLSRIIREELLQLEHAWQEGALPDALTSPRVQELLGPHVRTFYEDVIRFQTPKPNSVRTAALPLALARFQRTLQVPSRWQDARVTEAAPVDTEADSPLHPEQEEKAPVAFQTLTAAAKGRALALLDRPAPIRWDQGVDARFWGIGLRLSDETAELALRALLWERALQELTEALRSIVAVQLRVRERTAAFFSQCSGSNPGLDFEQLLLDILNEDERVARHASLREDWLEQTDIRLKYPELQRHRGARAQVCLSPKRVHKEQKLERMAFPQEVAVISPRTLAEHAARGGLEETLTTEQVEEFWCSLPRFPADVSELSRELRTLFGDALTTKQKRDAGLGPIDSIPSPIRRYIRSFARQEAVRSTAALRQRESSGGARRAKAPRQVR